MPELPDITVYVERARERLQGQVLRRVQLLCVVYNHMKFGRQLMRC